MLLQLASCIYVFGRTTTAIAGGMYDRRDMTRIHIDRFLLPPNFCRDSNGVRHRLYKQLDMQ